MNDDTTTARLEALKQARLERIGEQRKALHALLEERDLIKRDITSVVEQVKIKKLKESMQ